MDHFKIQKNFDLALQHHQSGRLHEAEQLYRLILDQQPNHAVAMHQLAMVAHQSGRNDIAVDLLRKVLALNPNWPEAHSNLGYILRENGQMDEAIVVCHHAIALRPNYAEAHNNLGLALKDKGQLDDAIAVYRQAIVLRSNFPEACNNLGIALTDRGQLDEAIAACRQAIALRPNFAEAYNNLANALKNKGQLDEAIAACRQAIDLRPNYAKAHSNLGSVLREQGRHDEAIAAFRQAIGLQPSLAEAHANLAAALLTKGDFQEGWQEHEWRWKCTGFFSHQQRNFAQPLWTGCRLEGRSILLHAEQGFGDTLQFIRYLPLVAQSGARIIIQCQAELQHLLRIIPVKCQVVARGQPLPAFDFHCPLLSLPRFFDTAFSSLPKLVPYLRPDIENGRNWQQRLAGHSRALKVGLAWAGSPEHKNDRNRSMKLAALAPLGYVRGVRFFSLQKGEAAAEANNPPAGMELVDRTQELTDFSDTAALIANLDLVIAVDTSVVHLAGAMGKPVWTLLPFVPDWRWLLEREDSPWYPTMRLFRQPRHGDWEPVIARVCSALSLWVKNGA